MINIIQELYFFVDIFITAVLTNIANKLSFENILLGLRPIIYNFIKKIN